MKEGDTITIIPSFRLYEMHLEHLIRHSMNVVEIVRYSNGKIDGCVASLTDEQSSEKQQWFVPYESIFMI